MPRLQSTPRKDSARGAAVARRLLADTCIHPSILVATIFVAGLVGEAGEVKHLRAGRSFVVNGLKVAKGDMTVLVQSKCAPGRWFVCLNGEWSTKDNRVIAQCNRQVAQFGTSEVTMPNGTRRMASQVNNACLNSLDAINAVYAEADAKWQAKQERMIANLASVA